MNRARVARDRVERERKEREARDARSPQVSARRLPSGDGGLDEVTGLEGPGRSRAASADRRPGMSPVGQSVRHVGGTDATPAWRGAAAKLSRSRSKPSMQDAADPAGTLRLSALGGPQTPVCGGWGGAPRVTERVRYERATFSPGRSPTSLSRAAGVVWDARVHVIHLECVIGSRNRSNAFRYCCLNGIGRSRPNWLGNQNTLSS